MKVKILSPVIINPTFSSVSVTVEAELEPSTETKPAVTEILSYSIPKAEIDKKREELKTTDVYAALKAILTEKLSVDLKTLKDLWASKKFEGEQLELTV